MLFCKNCGGKLVLGESSDEIICENCGKSQSIQQITNGTAAPLYADSAEINAAINTYRRAMNMYSQGESVRELDTAAQMFRSIPNVLNAKDMVMKCQQKSELLAKENSYKQAIQDMQSEDPRRVSAAVETLHLLKDFKDASQKETEAQSLLKVAMQKAQERETANKKAKRIKQLTAVAVLAVVVLIIVIAIAGNAAKYKSDNLTLSLTPCDDYLEVKSNRYIFYYVVEMENEGSLDIKAFRADVVIEDKDGKILVDTLMQASDNTALVREGKSRELTWELTVNDEKVAQALYEDFSDLKVRITVKQIEFADGEVKDY